MEDMDVVIHPTTREPGVNPESPNIAHDPSQVCAASPLLMPKAATFTLDLLPGMCAEPRHTP